MYMYIYIYKFIIMLLIYANAHVLYLSFNVSFVCEFYIYGERKKAKETLHSHIFEFKSNKSLCLVRVIGKI
jgi:hypothetical protein